MTIHRLFIAEKPSLAAEIANNLKGPVKKFKGYTETGEGTVTWCYGHILRTYEPDEYDEKYKKWNLADLPIVPNRWKLKPSESCVVQFHVIKKLLQEATEVVNAGDPDREGQLLIDEVLEHVGYKGKVLRILVNAMDEKSVKAALADLRDNKDFVSLRESALARQRADWLVGMNLTRAYTIEGRRAGHDMVFNVGRVKIPTLGLVVRREREIKNFKAVDFGTVKGEFGAIAGTFVANWKAGEDQEGLDSEGRLVDKTAMDRLIAKFINANEAAKVVFCETAPKKEHQPLPFSLSALQVAAGKRFGYSPQKVLDTAQSLYEKKLTSYPRSDCDYLPTSQLADVTMILGNLSRFNDEVGSWTAGANPKLKSRAWNDKEITAHHAIIPTTVCAKEKDLSDVEINLYTLVTQAYIAQFYPLHAYNQTKVQVSFIGEEFNASGRVVTDEGFKAIYHRAEAEDDKDAKDDEDAGNLPPMKKNDVLQFKKAVPTWKKTQPPKRFTEALLIQAMKDIHKFVQDPEKKKRLKSTKGIGTEATRSTIIKELIDKKFMKVVAKKLEPTPEAFVLIDALPKEITLPDETAEWEDGLECIYKKQDGVTLDTFVDGLSSRLPELMGMERRKKENGEWEIVNVGGGFEAKYPCPECGKGSFIRRPSKNKGEFWWGCSNYPECKATRPDIKGKPGEKTVNSKSRIANSTSDYPCPECKKGFLIKRKSKDGKKDWWGCNRYPDCKTTRFDDKGKPAKK